MSDKIINNITIESGIKKVITIIQNHQTTIAVWMLSFSICYMRSVIFWLDMVGVAKVLEAQVLIVSINLILSVVIATFISWVFAGTINVLLKLVEMIREKRMSKPNET